MAHGSLYRGICRICGIRLATKAGRERGQDRWRTTCIGCHKKKYTRHKKSACEDCGFVPVHMCQLDVDHVDGDKSNNTPSNLRTLCANCHRLKTHLAKDYMVEAKVIVHQQDDLFSLPSA